MCIDSLPLPPPSSPAQRQGPAGKLAAPGLQSSLGPPSPVSHPTRSPFPGSDTKQGRGSSPGLTASQILIGDEAGRWTVIPQTGLSQNTAQTPDGPAAVNCQKTPPTPLFSLPLPVQGPLRSEEGHFAGARLTSDNTKQRPTDRPTDRLTGW